MRRSQLWRVVALTSSLALVCTHLGCAGTAEELAEEAAEGAAAPVTTQTLAELNQPPNRQRLNRLLSLPAIADAGELFGRGLSRGTSAVWGEELSAAQLESMARAFLSAFGQAFERQMMPIVERATARTVEAGLLAALNDRSRRQVARFAAAVTTTIVDTTLDLLVERMDDDLGPAIRRMMRDQIGPGLAEAIRQHIGPATADMLTDDRVQQPLADTAQVVGRHLVFGVNQGAVEVSGGQPVGGGPIAGISETITAGQETLRTVLWMLGAAILILLLFIVVLGLGLWRTFERSQQLIEENKLREDALVGMARAVQAAEEKERTGVLEDALRGIEHRDGADRLRELLGRAGYKPDTESPQ